MLVSSNCFAGPANKKNEAVKKCEYHPNFTNSISILCPHARPACRTKKKEPAADLSGGTPDCTTELRSRRATKLYCQPLRNGIVGLELPMFLELRFHKWIRPFSGGASSGCLQVDLPSTKSVNFRFVAFLLFEQPPL